MIRIIEAKLIIEDVNNLSDQEAINTVTEMLNEVFGREESQEYPRCKLIIMDVHHK